MGSRFLSGLTQVRILPGAPKLNVILAMKQDSWIEKTKHLLAIAEKHQFGPIERSLLTFVQDELMELEQYRADEKEVSAELELSSCVPARFQKPGIKQLVAVMRSRRKELEHSIPFEILATYLDNIAKVSNDDVRATVKNLAAEMRGGQCHVCFGIGNCTICDNTGKGIRARLDPKVIP